MADDTKTPVEETDVVFRSLVSLFRYMASSKGYTTEDMENCKAETFALWLGDTAVSGELDDHVAEILDGLSANEEQRNLLHGVLSSPFKLGWTLRVIWPTIRYRTRKLPKHVPKLRITYEMLFDQPDRPETILPSGLVLPTSLVVRRLVQNLDLAGLSSEASAKSLIMVSGEAVGSHLIREGFDKIYEEG